MKLSNANMIDLIRTDTIFSRGSGNSEAQQGCTNSSGQEVIESIAGDHSLANDVLRGLREKQACYIKGLTNNSQSITTSSCFSSDSTNANSPMWCSDYDKVNTLRSDVHLTNREERIRSNDDPSIKRPAVVIRDSLPFVSEGKPTSSTGPSPPIYPLYNTRIMEEIQQLENDVKRLNVELHSDTNSIEECDKWGYSVDVCLPSTENMGLSHGSHTDALKSVTTSNVDDFLQLSASHELSRQGSHNNPPATVEFTGHQSDIGPSSSHSGAEGLTKLPLPLETVQVPISTKDNDEGHHSYHQSHSNNNLGTQLNTCSVPILTAQLANQSSLSVSFPSTQLSSPSQSRSPSITYSPPSSNIKSLPLCVSKSPSVLPFSRDSINSERAALVDNMSSKGKSLSYQRNKAILGQCNGLLPAGPNSLSGSTLSGYSTSVSGSSTVDIINNRISRSSSYSKSYHQKTHPLWMASVDKYLHATGETVGTGLSSRGHGDETIPAANVTGDNLLRTSSVIGDDKFDKADCRKKASWRCDSLPPAYSFFVNDTPSSGASDTCMSNIHTTPNSSFVFPQKQFMDTRHITSSNETRDYREGYHPSLYQGRHTYDKENTNTNANVKVHRQDQQSDNDCKRILLYRSSNIENPITVNRANH